MYFLFYPENGMIAMVTTAQIDLTEGIPAGMPMAT